MSIFKKVGRALGFSGEDDEMESQPYTAENITNACVRDQVAQNEAAVATPDERPAGSPEAEAARNEDPDNVQLPDSLLEVLVEMLNRSLPEYVVAALDKEAEKKYLFDQLDDSFKKFVADVNVRSREWIARKWEAKQKALTKEVEEARVKVKELEEQRNTMQSAQLSAERQKRAVTEKVHELEARVATLEAEKEQFDLENKSLVNKLKVSTVHQEELDSALAEINRLKGELKNRVDSSAELEQLRSDLQQAQEQLSQTCAKEQETAEQFEQLRGDLQKAQDELAQARQEEQAAANRLEASQKELSRQEEKITQLTEQIQKLETELSEARNGLKVVSEVETRLKQFEQVKAAKDEKIAQLTDEIHSLGEENNRLQARLNESLQPIAQLENQAREQSAHDEEIDSLKAELESANALVAALRNQRQELLAQIDDLRSVQTAEKENSVPSDTPPAETKPETKVINFDLPQNEEIASKPEIEPIKAASEQVESALEPAGETPEKKSRRKVKTPEPSIEETGDDDFPGLDTFGDNWLIPTRPDTPEMIAKRKEEEKKKREAEEQAALEQKKSRQVDPSQMSLW